jgi:hypothetical protein
MEKGEICMKFFSELFQKTILISLSLLTSTFYLTPKISVVEIKDLYNVLMQTPKYEYPSATPGKMMWETSYDITPTPCYEYTSPIFGALLWETDYIKNIYRIAPESKTKKLVKELFFFHHDDVTFDVTSNPIKPACYFTPQIIGQLVGLITNFELKKIEKSDLEKNLASIFSSLLFEPQTETQPKTKKQQLELKKAVLIKIQNFYKSIIERQENIKTELDKNPKKNDAKIKKITAIIKINRGIQNNPRTIINKERNKLVNTIIDAFSEEKTLYPEYNTIFIFLSFLWQKANSKQDFLDYFLSLYDTLKKPTNFFKQNYNLEDASKQDDFKNAKYSKQEYDQFYDTTLDINEYEKLAFLFIGFDAYKNTLPPHIEMKSSVLYKDQTFPDCGETSLLNLFNALFYYSDSKIFDLAIIEKLKPSERLLQFYKNHQTVEEMKNNDELHNNWALVVSELPGVAYGKNICDIMGGLQNFGINNMSKTIENLFPEIKNIKEGQNSLEKFALLLEKNGIKVDIQMPSEKNDPQIIVLTVTKNNRTFTLEWIFYSHHFVIQLLKLAKSNFKDKYKKLIETKIQSKENFFDVLKYITIGNTFECDINPSLLDSSLFLNSLLMQKIDLNKAEQLMNEIASDKYTLTQPATKDLLLNLYSIFPTGDQYWQTTAIKILQKKLNFDDYEKRLSETGKSRLIYILLYKKLNENSIEQIKILLNHIKQEKCLTEITSDILELDPIKIDKDFFGYLYFWIQNTAFPKIKYESYLHRIVLIILHLDPIKIDTDFLKQFYSWIQKNALPNLKNEFFLITITKQILHLDPIKIDKDFLKQLYSWIQKNVLPNLKDEIFLIITTEQTLLLDPAKTDKDSLNILYSGILKNALPGIKDKDMLHKIGYTMLNQDPKKIAPFVISFYNESLNIILKKLNDPNLNKQIKEWKEKAEVN